MFGLPLSFAVPGVLIGLLALPFVYFVARALPPKPKRLIFAAFALLQPLANRTESPTTSPLSLVILRCLAFTLFVLAASRPTFGTPPENRIAAPIGPMLIVVDNSWPSAAHWPEMQSLVRAAINDHRSTSADIRLFALAGTPESTGVAVLSPALTRRDALRFAANLSPQPWLSALDAVEAQLGELSQQSQIKVVLPPSSPAWPTAFISALDRLGSVQMVAVRGMRTQLTATRGAGADLMVLLQRFGPTALSGNSVTIVRGLDSDGRTVADDRVAWAAGGMRQTHRFVNPSLSREIARLQIDGETHIGAVFLSPQQRRRPRVGLATIPSGNQPYLVDRTYVRKALDAERALVEAPADRLADMAVDAIILPDSAPFSSRDMARFVENGGMLIRLAGPNLLTQTDPADLVPAPIRQRPYTRNGPLDWTGASTDILTIPDNSPLQGLPRGLSVRISSLALTTPGPGTTPETWAETADGAPFITARQQGRGLIVLFHAGALPTWSDLALQGSFVDVLIRVIDQAPRTREPPGTTPMSAENRTPRLIKALQADGQLRASTPNDQFIVDARRSRGASLPPGIYTDGVTLTAINADQSLSPAFTQPRYWQSTDAANRSTPSLNVWPYLLLLALAVYGAEALLTMALTGRRPTLSCRNRLAPELKAPALLLAMGCAALLTFGPQRSYAESPPAAALGFHLAYVETGSARADGLARAALSGLSDELRLRTILDPGPPIGLLPGRDDLSLFPVIFYWPPPDAAALPKTMASALADYVANGGCLIIDLGDLGGGELLLPPGLQLPSLVSMPEKHGLKRSFYLLEGFPGRAPARPVWVEPARPDTASDHDGVSRVIVGAQDWAAAWARDAKGYPLAAIDPPRQRELAVRAGVNMVLYALTGNYKADQVHAAAALATPPPRRGVKIPFGDNK